MPKLYLLLLATLVSTAADSEQERKKPNFDHDILADTFGFDLKTPRSVPLSEFHQGCPARDCFVSIDDPQFIATEKVDFMNDGELVIALEHNGIKRVYPTRILVRHEIVNDQIGDTPVVVTYCPLCGSGLAFVRHLNGKTVEFGVSGVLHNSDLVMYDRQTESLWGQVTGTAVVGPETGHELEGVPVTMTQWGVWKAQHPDSQVLTIPTGGDRDYSEADPYGDYTSSEKIFFPIEHSNAFVHPKTVVYGIEVGGQFIAYSEELLKAEGLVSETINGMQLTISIDTAGTVTAKDSEDNEIATPIRLFWFAWYTFHPSTEIRIADQ